MVIDVGVHVDHDSHVMVIGATEHLTHSREMIWIVYIHVRVAEVQLQSGAEVSVFRTSCDLFERICPEWIDAAKSKQPMRVLRNLHAGPVVFSDHLRVFIRHWRLVWIREAICNRQYDGSADSSGVKLC